MPPPLPLPLPPLGGSSLHHRQRLLAELAAEGRQRTTTAAGQISSAFVDNPGGLAVLSRSATFIGRRPDAQRPWVHHIGIPRRAQR